MNHSCEPNYRQFAVSWNKYDHARYNLALFALEDILANTKLTVDYIDLEDLNDDEDFETPEIEKEEGGRRHVCELNIASLASTCRI
jgi:histone-lysine N-methyltransferase SUV39H